MPEGAAGGGLLVCTLVIGLAIETLLGAVFLRAAVALYNTMAGGPCFSVPRPAFGKAMWVIFESTVFQMIVGGLCTGVSTGPGPVAAGEGGRAVDVFAHYISLPVGLLIMASVVSAKLPTTFGRAILVTFCYLLVVLLVVGALVGMVVLLFRAAKLLWGMGQELAGDVVSGSPLASGSRRTTRAWLE